MKWTWVRWSPCAAWKDSRSSLRTWRRNTAAPTVSWVMAMAFRRKDEGVKEAAGWRGNSAGRLPRGRGRGTPRSGCRGRELIARWAQGRVSAAADGAEAPSAPRQRAPRACGLVDDREQIGAHPAG